MAQCDGELYTPAMRIVWLFKSNTVVLSALAYLPALARRRDALAAEATAAALSFANVVGENVPKPDTGSYPLTAAMPRLLPLVRMRVRFTFLHSFGFQIRESCGYSHDHRSGLPW